MMTARPPMDPEVANDKTADDADDLSDEAGECRGHPAGTVGVMGATVYCDGSCRP